MPISFSWMQLHEMCRCDWCRRSFPHRELTLESLDGSGNQIMFRVKCEKCALVSKSTSGEIPVTAPPMGPNHYRNILRDMQAELAMEQDRTLDVWRRTRRR